MVDRADSADPPFVWDVRFQPDGRLVGAVHRTRLYRRAAVRGGLQSLSTLDGSG